MLHKLELPSYKDQLEHVLDFQQHLLTFACDPSTPLSPDPQTIVARFGKDIGGWLCERLWRQGPKQQPQQFYKQLVAIIVYARKYQLEAQEIVKAFVNDREFYLQLNDPTFEFKYRTLSSDAKEVLEPLMVSFYKKLLYLGFPPCIHFGQAEPFRRKTLLEGFEQANPRLKVCPGCDGPLTRLGSNEADYDEIEVEDDGDAQNDDEGDYEEDLSDIDHFFPKKLLPFLAVHTYNLVPLCIKCNIKVKKQKDPVDVPGPDELNRIFLPFVRPAVPVIDINIARNMKGILIISVRDTEQISSRRVHNLDRLFELRRSWKYRLDRYLDLVQYQLSEVRERAKKTGERIDKEKVVEQKLCENLGDYDNNVGFIEDLLIKTGYSRYALGNVNERDALIALMSG